MARTHLSLVADFAVVFHLLALYAPPRAHAAASFGIPPLLTRMAVVSMGPTRPRLGAMVTSQRRRRLQIPSILRATGYPRLSPGLLGHSAAPRAAAATAPFSAPEFSAAFLATHLRFSAPRHALFCVPRYRAFHGSLRPPGRRDHSAARPAPRHRFRPAYVDPPAARQPCRHRRCSATRLGWHWQTPAGGVLVQDSAAE